MESVFINYLRKASLLGLAGLLVFTFLILSKDIIGKDLLPALSEENSFELLKYVLRGGFIIIIIVVILAFIKSIIPSSKEKVKEKKKVLKHKKSKWWIYPLLFILGVVVSLGVIAYVKNSKEIKTESYSSIQSQIDNDMWDIRSTNRVKTEVKSGEITYSNKTDNTYFRNINLSMIESAQRTFISTTFHGAPSTTGYFGLLISDKVKTYTIYINDSNEIYLGRIIDDDNIKLVDWNLNNNLTSINTFNFLIKDGSLVIKINGVKFVPIDEFSNIQEFAYAVNNSDITIIDFEIE